MSKKPYLNITAEQTAAIIARYTAGDSTADIAADYGCHRTSINNILKTNGVAARKNWQRIGRSAGLTMMSEEQSAELARAYTVDRASIESLAAKYDVNPITIRRKLKSLGVTVQHGKKTVAARAERLAEGMLECNTCSTTKPVAEFHADPNMSTGYAGRCKCCERTAYLLRTYGITDTNYDAMLTMQEGGCAVCGAAEASARNNFNRYLCIDHNHKTGQIRGLLCACCNTAAGHLMTDAGEDTAFALVNYIRAANRRVGAPTVPTA